MILIMIVSNRRPGTAWFGVYSCNMTMSENSAPGDNRVRRQAGRQ
jgi:hypothetical protein